MGDFMNKPFRLTIVLLAAMILLIPISGFAEITLPSVISNNMVLQQEKTVVIWGWADPGEQVTVTISERKGTAVTGPDGSVWLAAALRKSSRRKARLLRQRRSD